MRLELSCGEASPSKEEGRCEIVPDRIAEKIRKVQAIPRRFAYMPRKSRAGIGALFDNRTVTALDPNSVCGEIQRSSNHRPAFETPFEVSQRPLMPKAGDAPDIP